MRKNYGYSYRVPRLVEIKALLLFAALVLFNYCSASSPCANPSGPQTMTLTSISNGSSPVTLAGTVGMQYITNVTGVIIFANIYNTNAAPTSGTDYNVGDALPSGSIVIFKGGTVGATIPWSYNSTAQGGTPLSANTFYYFNAFSYASGSCATEYSGTWIFSGMMPNINLTSNATGSSCSNNATTATVTYNFTSGAPDQYALLWNTAAKNAGFVNNPPNSLCGNGNYVALTGSPITITIPANVTPGTYTGYIDPNNSSTGFDNCNYNGGGTVNCPSFQITVGSGTSAPLGNSYQSFCHGATVGDLICFGTDIQWYATPTGGTPLATSDTLTDGADYYASQTISGCESTSRLDVTVAVAIPPPSPTITSANDSLFSSSDSVYTSWQWSLNDTIIPGATTPDFLVTQNGSYVITVTDANGCTATSSPFTFPPLGVNELNNISSFFSLSPNPATNQLTLHTSSPFINAVVTVSIMNVLGETIRKENINCISEANINIKTLSTGIYFLQLKTESFTVVKKFIKE